jgi:hypothetical protein
MAGGNGSIGAGITRWSRRVQASERSALTGDDVRVSKSLVLDMLTSGKRKHKDARTLTEVWADLVLENPAQEFARVARELLPQAVDRLR